MTVFRVEARSGQGWDLIGSATQRDEAEKIVNERIGHSTAGWITVESGSGEGVMRVWMRKDAAARITERQA